MVRKIEMKPVHRRDMMKIVGAGAVTGIVATMLPNLAMADAASAAAAVKKAAGGKTPASGKITLELPQIAENGNTVPIGFEVESPMTDSNYVKTVHIFADKNPNPQVAVLHFTAGSGRAKASTRMRMAKTQNVIAVAEMSDGSVYMAKSEVKVTIGGCGG
jgi:sulfur-oxidizing protein SoxY